MTGLIHFFRLLFNPRGRANRQTLLLAAGIAVLLEIFVLYSLPSKGEMWLTPAVFIKATTIWICCASVIKRLHDMDYSGWCLPAGIALACMWTALVGLIAVFFAGSSILQPVESGSAVVLGLVMLPVLAATLWLHFTPGTPVVNRFGAPEKDQAKIPKPTQVATAL